MKAQILKIAGVKSEKEFYKKYPTEAAFMKAHGKAFKKAQIGAYIGGDTNANPQMVDFGSAIDYNDKLITGSTEQERQEAAYKQAMLEATKSKGAQPTGASDEEDSSFGMGDIGGMMGGEGGEGGGGMMEMLGGMFGGGAKYGTNIPKAQAGTNTNSNNWWSNIQPSPGSGYPANVSQTYGIGAQTMGKMQSTPAAAPVGQPVDTSNPNWMMKDTSGAPYADSKINQNYTGFQGEVPEDTGLSSKLGGLTKMLGPVGDLIGGIDALKGEQEAANRAKQMRMLSELQLKASTTRPEQKERRYVRPEDVVNTGEAFFPIYGVGTNVLARNGVKLQGGGMIGGNPTEIQNTYGNGHSIYDDLGYAPLIDVNQQKSFYYGGGIPKAQGGFNQAMSNWSNSMSGGGSGFSGAGESGGTPWGAIGNIATNIGNTVSGGPNAGGNIGGTIGGSVGAIFGPAGSAIGNFAGTMIGKTLDPYAGAIKRDTARTKRNIQNLAFNQIAPSIQAGYASHMEDGGWVSNDWTPQVIAKFGDLDAQDYAEFAHKDQFRAGGHLKQYTPPSERAMQTFAMGGELQTHWGGYAEPMSYNPYLPGSGETVMFRGKSHEERSPNGETGIGITYGGNPVEVERGEPMVELEEGGVVDPMTGEVKKSGVVFGNLKIPNQYINLLGDPKAKDKKFKNYVADLSKIEEKQNKMIAKSTDELNSLDVKSSFDRLKLASLQANIEGGNLKLKEIADKKINAAALQNAINDTAEEYGLVADDLARGKVKEDVTTRQARLGAAISKAKDGVTTTKETTVKPTEFTSIEAAKKAGFVQDAKGNWYRPREGKKRTTTEKKSASAMDTIPKQSVDQKTGLFGGVTPEQFEAYKKKNSWYNWDGFDPNDPEDVDKYAKAFNAEAEKRGSKARILPDDTKTGKTKYVGKQFTSANIEDVKEEEPGAEAQEYAVINEPSTTPVPYKRSPWIDFGNQLLDYIRPSNQTPFDYGQLMGEMYALSSNQLEPVQAQLYHPELGIPYDISYQDVLNENQADFNAQTRQTGYNPAAQANLNAQKYMANQKVLGEQFRANQAMKAAVYDENRKTLNEAKLTNLGILDKQYQRQAEAMSNTKATTQAVLNSISDKMAKHELENKTLGIYENLYKYRYDKRGRAINMNGLFQPNIPTIGSTTGTQKQVPVYKEDGTIDHYQLQEMTPEEIAAQKQAEEYTAVPPAATPGINGNVQTKTKKESRNGSIVKAIKNL